MKLEFKEKVTTLLRQESQIYGALHKTLDTKRCFCIEGLFIVALGGVPVIKYNGFILDNLLEVGFLSQNKFIENEIEPNVNIKWILENKEQINLTEEQIDFFEKYGYRYNLIKWRYLNDDAKLTFEQFEKLINLL